MGREEEVKLRRASSVIGNVKVVSTRSSMSSWQATTLRHASCWDPAIGFTAAVRVIPH
jgi:hypothetical protein